MPYRSLDNPPLRAAIHLLADFAELLCFADVDGEYSLAELGVVRKTQATEQVSTDLLEEELLLEIEEGETGDYLRAVLDLPEDELDDEAFDEGDGPNEDPGPAAADDQREAEKSDLAGHLEFRSAKLGDHYPFEVYDEDNLRLKSDLTDVHKLYLALLLCASLGRVDKTTEGVLTKQFEHFVVASLQAYLGPRAQVGRFGTSAGGRWPGDNLYERLKALAEDVKAPLKISQEEVAQNISGDHGLDIAAWFPFEDEQKGPLTLFAQCACGTEWRKKQQEAADSRWRSILDLSSPLVNATLIPYWYRESDGAFHAAYVIEHGLLFDRERIVLSIVSAEAPVPMDDLPHALMGELQASGRSG